jgi:uncharacterized membrane protein
LINGWARPIVALALIICAGAVYYFVAAGFANIAWKDVVMIIVGALVANLTTVVNYYFGSSQGSDDKNRTIAEALKK